MGDDTVKIIDLDPAGQVNETDELILQRGIETLRISKTLLFNMFMPPVGGCRIISFYVDPVKNKIIVEYDDTLQI